jgi:hypothetical protein
MPVNGDQQQRMVELVAEIEVEKDQTRFAALVRAIRLRKCSRRPAKREIVS